MKGEKGPAEAPTRWSRFKNALSDTFTRNTDKLIKKSMASSNIGTTIDLLGKVPQETQKEALEWLKKNGKYHNGMNKTIYKKALKEDGVWTELFVDAYQKADDTEKSRLWSMMGDDLNTLVTRVEFCDIIDEELRNASRIYVEIGKIDENADHTVCWDALIELFEGRGGNSPEVRKFALNTLYDSDYNEVEFWKKILTTKENGSFGEMKKHTIKLLMKEETIGGMELLWEQFEDVKENLAEMMGGELQEHEAEGIMKLILRKMTSGNQEDYNRIYINGMLPMAVSDDHMMRKNTSAGLKGLVDEGDENAERIVNGLLVNAEQMIMENTVGFLSQAMNIVETLEFTEKAEEIKKVIDNRINVHIRKKIERMFESSEIEENLRAANTLMILRGHKDARKMIKEIAIPELRDIAEDENMADVYRKKAAKKLQELEKVVSDE